MQKAILHRKDEVNAKFQGLDVTIAQDNDKLKYFVPYAYHLRIQVGKMGWIC